MNNIWTNGCFDIVHIGHMKLFEYAKSLGDKLVVGIDSDNRVKQLKGSGRPINSAAVRREFLLGIKFIDDVVIYDNEEEFNALIAANNISTIVIGDEYKNRPVLGSDLCKVIFFERIKPYSTSEIIKSSQWQKK